MAARWFDSSFLLLHVDHAFCVPAGCKQLPVTAVRSWSGGVVAESTLRFTVQNGSKAFIIFAPKMKTYRYHV